MPYIVIVAVAILVALCAIFASHDPKETAEIIADQIIDKGLGLQEGTIEKEIDDKEK